MGKIASNSLEESRKIAADWLKKIQTKARDGGAAVIAGLTGHLGSGKTAFVKAVASELKVPEIVTSPTFVLMKIYGIDRDAAQSPFSKLVHIDAYRLEDRDDFAALDFGKLAADRENLIMIEWPENVGFNSADFAPGCFLKFEIQDGLYTVSIS